MAIRRTPQGVAISLATATTIYNLYTLLQASTFTLLPKKAQWLSIQLSPSAGAAQLMIGEEAVSSSNCGIVLGAGQNQVWDGSTNNLIRLDDMYLTSDTNTQTVFVSWISR